MDDQSGKRIIADDGFVFGTLQTRDEGGYFIDWIDENAEKAVEAFSWKRIIIWKCFWKGTDFHY